MRLCVVLLTVAIAASAATLEAQKTLADGVKDLAAQISASATKAQKGRVAVLSFKELDGQTTVLGSFLAEELVTLLVNSGIHVVERSMLDKLLSEQKLQQDIAIDPATAKQVGKIAGVGAIVTGSVTDLASQLGINCRLIDTATGEIFAAAQTKITKDDDVKKIMGAALPGNAAPSTRKRSPAATARSWERGGVRYTVESAQRNERTVELLVVLEHDKPENVRANPGGWYLMDDNGDHWSGGYDSKHILINGGVTLLPGTRVRSTFPFRCHDGSCNGTRFTIAHPDGAVLLRDLLIH